MKTIRTKTLKILFNLIPEIESLENLDKTISNFQEMVYHLQIIQEDFDWANWEEGKQILQNSDKGFDKYDIDTLCKLITAIVRNDKYNENYLESKFIDGTILKIIKAMENNIENYDIDEHTHRFAVWTAARAAQRQKGAIKTELVELILDKKCIEKLSNIEIKNLEDYKVFHKEIVSDVFKNLRELLDSNKIKGVTDSLNFEEVSYGRVSKIISIYIKTCYVLRYPNLAISKYAYPPIDSILLRNLYDRFRGIPNTNILKGYSWTKPNDSAEDDYFDVIEALISIKQHLNLDSFWKLEFYWNSVKEKTKK